MSSTIEYRGLSIELPDGAFSFGKDGSLTLSVDAPTTITLRPISDEAGAGVGASVRLPLQHHCAALARALARTLSVPATVGATAAVLVVEERLSPRSPAVAKPPSEPRRWRAGGRPRRQENVGGRHPWRGGRGRAER